LQLYRRQFRAASQELHSVAVIRYYLSNKNSAFQTFLEIAGHQSTTENRICKNRWKIFVEVISNCATVEMITSSKNYIYIVFLL